MDIKIKIDTSCKLPKVVIFTEKVTDKVNKIVETLSECEEDEILGVKDEKVYLLKPIDIIRIYAMEGKVFAVKEDGEYRLKLRLYEAEEILEGKKFVRISNSEIINLKKVKNFDLSITGTIQVNFLNGDFTYASRRYVTKIRKKLGI